jgi:ribosomal protein L29
MKKKNLKEVSGKTLEELKKDEKALRIKAFQFYAKIKAGQEKNVRRAFLVRKELAQVLTLIRQKEIIADEEREEKEIKEEIKK